jgi:hypothetical protein
LFISRCRDKSTKAKQEPANSGFPSREERAERDVALPERFLRAMWVQPRVCLHDGPADLQAGLDRRQRKR